MAISGDWEYSIIALERFFESFKHRCLQYFVTIGYYAEYYKVTTRKYVKKGVIKSAYVENEFLE